MIRIGLLGCGNIGRIIVRHGDHVKISALYDKVPDRARELASICGGKAGEDFESFVDGDYGLVVEAASVRAVKEYAENVLSHGKDLVIMSVGALADENFRNRLIDRAAELGRRIYIPSGAIFGLDNLKVGQISSVDRVVLRTTKNPVSLGIRADTRTRIFAGKAHECIKEYPKNVNVSVALGLAAGRDVDVELWADPDVDRNVHELFVEGEFGDAYIRVRNVPSPENPATSYLAALSILVLLKNLDEPLRVGT
ncbi:MAG: aspartate dehydrogenase [Methanoregulaceae archaeon]|nr:aspartate dehydrogenase [Methanoregulaceae archaeon]